MIDVYYWPTPNGKKITIFLEETGLEYRVIPVNIRNGEQFKPDFLKISPNNRMPANPAPSCFTWLKRPAS
jgi:GSH-dependent disulfide-bond oxidoreductase